MRFGFIMPKYVRDYLKRVYISRIYSVILKENTIVSLNSIFEGKSVIEKKSNITDSFIGLGTYIAPNSYMPNTKIGRFCSIGQNVRACIGRHPASKFVSTHPAFFSKDEHAGFTFVDENKYSEHLYIDTEKRYVLEIGNDVWIGNNVMILDGVKIGEGAVVGAGAIVTKDIEPYSINVGIPARKIKYRFEQKYIEFLLKFRWWEKEWNWIAENAKYFEDIEQFYNRFKDSI